MLTPSQGIHKWHPPSYHFSKSAGGTKSHLSQISDGNPMAKPRKRSSGSGAGKNSHFGNTQNGFHSAKPLLFQKVVFGWREISQPHPDEFQPLWSEISATYAQGAARKCFRAKGRNTCWGCR
ncbi:hypothetical protein AVEN_65789-1 [Araneus ventricosus]|uniref:Uncharacterized protein n=1 Tax=Araneus ventricosus TaxID=182803 RepID=A0A4Y2TRQ3_ARAVE|nr:hypothetical protein AVEN_65789-1 [Araneus ventricosus]